METASATHPHEPPTVGVIARARRARGLYGLAFLWVLFLSNFTALGLGSGDATTQFFLVQRFFGDASHADGYYFGLAFIEVPFYALSKLLEVVGIHSFAGQPLAEAVIGVGMGLLVLPGVALLIWILNRLRLPTSPTVLIGSVFGTPLFYYAVFAPGKNHLADALLFAVTVALAFRYFRTDAPHRRIVASLAAVLGFSMTVRYFAGAELVALGVALLWFRRWRDAVIVVIGATLTALLLAAIPKAYGVGIFTSGAHSPEDVLVFAPLNPLRMLFTDHRGLFVWSPVAVVGVVGYVRLLRTRVEHRRFLTVVAFMGLAIVGAHAFIPFWDGTFSFSQRFLTPLFVLIAIGLASAFDARPRLVSGVTALCVAWSLFLCFNLQTIGGWMFFNRESNGATALAGLPHHEHYSPGSYTWGVYKQSRLVRSWLPWAGSAQTRP
jgi:hypothetical protein